MGLPIRLATFNIQHGIDGTDKYNLQRAIDTIGRVRPDIVGLQEVTRNHPFYACDDQPARIAEGVRAATGQNWDVTYQQEWFTPDVSCQASGRGDAFSSVKTTRARYSRFTWWTMPVSGGTTLKLRNAFWPQRKNR